MIIIILLLRESTDEDARDVRHEVEREVGQTERGGRLLRLECVGEGEDVVQLLFTQGWTQGAQRLHLILQQKLTTITHNQNGCLNF